MYLSIVWSLQIGQKLLSKRNVAARLIKFHYSPRPVHHVHLKLGHRFHALLKVCSDRDNTVPLTSATVQHKLVKLDFAQPNAGGKLKQKLINKCPPPPPHNQGPKFWPPFSPLGQNKSPVSGLCARTPQTRTSVFLVFFFFAVKRC